MNISSTGKNVKSRSEQLIELDQYESSLKHPNSRNKKIVHERPEKDRALLWLRREANDGFKRSENYFDDVEKGGYKISYSPGGRLVELKRILGEKPDGLGKSKGDIVDGYSRESRNRFLKILFSIDYVIMGTPLFYTLTYPGEYSNDPRIWKRDLMTFIKRLKRLYPDLCGTWRLEPQKRGAPHYCGFLWGCPDLGGMKGKELFSKMWFEVVGSGDEKHLRAGTGIEVPYDLTGTIFYIAKYQAKDEKGGVKQEFDYPVGRYWGIFNRDKVAIQKEEIELDRKLYFKIRRIIKKKLEKRLTRNKFRDVVAKKSSGLWVSMSNIDVMKILKQVVENEESEAKNESRSERESIGHGRFSTVDCGVW